MPRLTRGRGHGAGWGGRHTIQRGPHRGRKPPQGTGPAGGQRSPRATAARVLRDRPRTWAGSTRGAAGRRRRRGRGATRPGWQGRLAEVDTRDGGGKAPPVRPGRRGHGQAPPGPSLPPPWWKYPPFPWTGWPKKTRPGGHTASHPDLQPEPGVVPKKPLFLGHQQQLAGRGVGISIRCTYIHTYMYI